LAERPDASKGTVSRVLPDRIVVGMRCFFGGGFWSTGRRRRLRVGSRSEERESIGKVELLSRSAVLATVSVALGAATALASSMQLPGLANNRVAGTAASKLVSLTGAPSTATTTPIGATGGRHRAVRGRLRISRQGDDSGWRHSALRLRRPDVCGRLRRNKFDRRGRLPRRRHGVSERRATDRPRTIQQCRRRQIQH
jgi:hypothetical protein